MHFFSRNEFFTSDTAWKKLSIYLNTPEKRACYVIHLSKIKQVVMLMQIVFGIKKR